MAVQTRTLSEFLLARIAEDEAMAAEALQLDLMGLYWTDNDPAEISISAERLRRECQAKRRMVEMHYEHNPDECRLCEREMQWPCDTLRALALPFADHPDYRQEWRP